MSFKYRFSSYKGHITNKMLDEAYGNKGRMFLNGYEANAFAEEHKGTVCKIVDYMPKDIETIFGIDGCFINTKPRRGASPHLKGWLVSL